jgi:NitT/TauT family transport system ATP-binding protein
MTADTAHRTERFAKPAREAERAGDAYIAFEAISKRYQSRGRSTLALSDITLEVAREEFVSIVGPSGCGKTTLLRILAGLVAPTEGQVRVEGQGLWDGARRDDRLVERMALVFQDANLFPWYSVLDNISLPLRLRGVDKRERRERARELADLVGLGGFEKAHPRELSGGMRQRVAIARALSYRPEILLMDEPFGALDALTRDRMNLELQSIAARTKATVVFVTHSIGEAVFLSDRVVLLRPRPGRIQAVTEVGFARPRSLDVEAEPGYQDAVLGLRRQLETDDHEEATA